MNGMRSSQVAAAAGVNRQTLRYYERRGLLVEPARSLGGHRLYPEETVMTLRVIKAAQRLGFTLDEVAELLDTARHQRRHPGDRGLRARAEAKLVEVEAKHRPARSCAAEGPPGCRRWAGRRDQHRVVFSGREGRREWRYADMVGPAHHVQVPLTLLHATDQGRLAGLLVPPAAAVNFRFYLTLAFAAATGERAGVAAQLDALMVTHQGARPVPPPPAEPDQAPLTAQRTYRRAAATAAAVASVAFATLTAGNSGSQQAGVPYRAEVGGTGVATATDAPNAFSVIAPTTRGNPVAPGGGTAASGTGVVKAPSVGGATGGIAPIGRAATAIPGRSIPPAVPATGPGSPPAATTGPAPNTAPARTTAPPSKEPPVVDLCGSIEPLRLPLLQPLPCPPANP